MKYSILPSGAHKLHVRSFFFKSKTVKLSVSHMKLAFIHFSEKQNPYCTSLFITPVLAGFHPPLLSLFSSQTVLLSVFMFQLLRTVGLRAFSMASETYTSGTHSAAFVTCPNDTVARDLAR